MPSAEMNNEPIGFLDLLVTLIHSLNEFNITFTMNFPHSLIDIFNVQ